VETLLQIYSCFFSHSIKLYVAYSVTVSVHYLSRYLCSTVTSRAPIQWFPTNSDCSGSSRLRIVDESS